MKAVVRTAHDRPDVVARALAPDHTDEIGTVVAGDLVVTTIERPTPGSLRATVDDYLVNLAVADAQIESMTSSEPTPGKQ